MNGGIIMTNKHNSVRSFNPYDFLDRNRERTVVFYGRVSTEHEAQISALENQMQWYEEQAKIHPNWNVTDRYIDEGITGTQAKKRPSFLQMIEDAKLKKFDLIVTREVCRFARNTVDTLVTTRELKNIGIEVYFVEDNIWTMDGDGELRLSLMATLAQEESRKVSERVKAGQQISRENGTIYGSGNVLGYDRCNGTYVINEEQAETVRLIYNMYINENIGCTKIANRLTEMHRLNASGIVKWSPGNITRILSNQTYIGYMAYGKSYNNNYLEQRRVNNYDNSTYMCVKADFEPIISEEVWYKCQEIKKRRISTSSPHQKHGKLETTDLWAKKLRCSCGASFRKNRWHKNKNCDWSYGYQCYNQLNNGTAKKRRDAGEDDTGYCDQKMIVDWKLELMGKMILEEIWKNRKECIIETIELIKKCYKESIAKENKPKTSILSQIEKLKRKKAILLEMRTDGELTKDEYIEQKDILNNKISALEKELDDNTANDYNKFIIDYDKILDSLNELIDLSKPKADHDILEKFVSKIVLDGNNHFRWYMNLDNNNEIPIDVNVNGRKNKAVVSIDKFGEELPIHSDKINNEIDSIYFIDKKSLLEAMQHRLQLLTRNNF